LTPGKRPISRSKREIRVMPSCDVIAAGDDERAVRTRADDVDPVP
jgi:hypothetical protein